MAITAISCLLLIYVLAYTYLKLNHKPVKSDIVVLFIGPDYEKRLKEARQLIKEKYSKVLIIPAYHREYAMVDGILKVIKNYQITGFDKKDYPYYYENTHIEILEAKKMMNMAGYTSAIFVSSPYHMRRISIIAARVFADKDYNLKFTGSRYVQQDDFLSILNWPNIKQVFKEYGKIIGFYLYQFYETIVQVQPD